MKSKNLPTNHKGTPCIVSTILCQEGYCSECELYNVWLKNEIKVEKLETTFSKPKGVKMPNLKTVFCHKCGKFMDCPYLSIKDNELYHKECLPENNFKPQTYWVLYEYQPPLLTPSERRTAEVLDKE